MQCPGCGQEVPYPDPNHEFGPGSGVHAVAGRQRRRLGYSTVGDVFGQHHQRQPARPRLPSPQRAR